MIARPLPISRTLRALAPVVFLATLLCVVAAPASAQTCFVEATGDNTTDYSGNGSDALQAAVNAASSGSTLKIAGTCTGVQTVAGRTQTVSVGKALTLVGGYAAGNWSVAPNPVANPTVLDAGGAGRVAFVTPSGDLTLRNLVLQNGSSSFGGAIWHEGPLVLENCLFQGNSAVAGGAIWVQGGSLTVRRSSFVGNTATTNSGGAINNSGLPMVIEHSTFSGNSAAVEGGAVTGADAPMSIRFSTFSDNSASSGGGLAATPDFTLYATIIANSTGGGDCAEIGAGPVDGGYNLIEDGSCLGAPTSLSGDPALDVLAANGGVGPTHALQQTSPARDAIPINVNGCGVDGATDQRGVLRGQDAGCDLGAIETYAPVATNDAYTVVEDGMVTGNMITDDTGNGADSDIDSSALTVSLGSNVSHGTLSLASNGSFAYTPNPDFNGTDSFNYILSDGDLTDTATVTLTVTPVNDPPVATDDAYTVNEDGTLSGNVVTDDTGNGADSDIDSSPLTASLGSNVSHGTLSLASNGSFTYTPNPDFNGTDSFTYVLSDGQLTDTAGVTLTVLSAPDLTGSDPVHQALNVDPDRNNITLNFDANVDPTTVSPQTLGLHRSMGRTAWDFDVNGGTVTLLPGSFFAGEVVHLTISDGVRSTDGGVATPHQLRFTAGATAPPACARQWTDIGAGLTGASDSDVAWGDADGDGDLDILVLGSTGTSSQITHLYLNDGGTFTNALANLPGSSSGSVAWGDYDGDGDLDVLLIRESASRLYRNDGGIFTNSGVGLPGLLNADAAWGDYDNDGDLDFVVAGATLVMPYPFDPTTVRYGDTRLYRNDGGSFTRVTESLGDLYDGSVAWGDYDNDGDLDLLLTGTRRLSVNQATPETYLYRNDGGTFVERSVMQDVYRSEGEWADVDGDGDLDVLLTGSSLAGSQTLVYRNDGGSFVERPAGLLRVSDSALAAGDYDADGDLDILLIGQSGSQAVTRLYRNDGGAFVTIQTGLPGVQEGSVEWGDYDGDGDLDILLSGWTGSIRITRVYRNDHGCALTDDNYTAVQDLTFRVDAAAGVTSNDQSGPYTVALDTPPTHGTVDLAADGGFDYTPTPGFTGADSFRYTLVGWPDVAAATVAIEVRPLSGLALDDAYGAIEDTPLTVAAPGVSANDAAYPVTLTVDVAPTHGTVTLDADGGFVYTPAPNFNGVDGFAYRATLVDDPGVTDTAVVTLTVTPVNDAPVAVDDAYETIQDTALVVDAPGVLANDSDGDEGASTLTASLDSGPLHGTLAIDPDGSFVYTPDAGYQGVDSFTYVLSDGELTDTAVVTLTVQAAFHTLNVVLTGNGSGTVTSDPAGIDCGIDCSEVLPEGTVVTLTATPDPGSAVGSGWLCAGDSCTVTISGDLTVGGDFGLTGVDTHIVDGVACTLGDAIEAANRDATVGGCIDERIGSDVIELAVDAVLTAADPARSTEIGGAYAGLPDVTSAIVIRAGTAGSRIERDPSFVCDVADPIDEFRLLQVTDGGALTLEGLILANGCADQGGAVLVDGNGVLAIVDSTFVGNSARSDGFVAQGGALWAAATATTSIDGALFQSNVASGPRAEGGALWDGGALGTLSASRFADNEVRSTELWADGGAAYVDGDPTITGVIFERNLAQAADRSGASGGNSKGGALFLYGDGATITDSLFSQNVARGGDGDVLGGIVQGGALSTDDRGGGTSLVRISFAGNRAEGGVGGAAGGGDANGGAVFAYGVTQIDTVTFSGNTAHGGDSVDGAGGIGAGGALFVDTVDLPLAIEHTTFAANEALAGSGAGGAGSAEGGGISANDGVTVFGSLFEGNIATVGGTSTSSACFDPGFSGPLPYLSSLGFNVLSGQVGACAFDAATDVLDAGPSLLPLGEYGCSTALPDGSCLPTHPIVIGSPAHEAGSCSATGVNADARGYSRPWDDPDVANVDDGCDAGAYESRDLNNDEIDDDYQSVGLDQSSTDLMPTDPNPSVAGEAVTVHAVVTGSTQQPADGEIVITASTGETCSSSTLSAGTGLTVEFSCDLVFLSAGARELVAHFGQSTTHRFSDSATEPHSVVLASNTPPAISVQSSVVILEDSPSAAIAVQLSDAQSDPAMLLLTASSSNQSLVSDLALAAGLGGSGSNRSLVITPEPDANGSATLTLTVSDPGGLSADATLQLQVQAVNDAPTLQLGTDPTLPAGSSGPQTAAGFAGIDAGPPDEDVSQTALAFVLDSLSDPDGILQAGSLGIDAPNGDLGYTLTGTGGQASVQVRVRDSGGVANGGEDTSAPLTLRITVEPSADLQIAKASVAVAQTGDPVVYTLTVANAGPNAVIGASLADPMPLDLLSPLWACLPEASSAPCPTPASGSGDLAVSVDLPVGTHLRFDVSGLVGSSVGTELSNTATITAPAGIVDLQPANNQATASILIVPEGIFANGFEATQQPLTVPAAAKAQADGMKH